MDDWQKQKFDPRSPVQPGRSAAPYFVLVVLGAVLLWITQQYWIARSGSHSNGPIPTRPPSRHEAQSARGDLRTLFSADDYPASALRNGEQGAVQARLSIDADGRVSECSIIRSSGHASLDAATCNILQRRARFLPAHNANGNPTTDTVITPPVVWRLEG